MAKTYVVMKEGRELEILKNLAQAKKLADTRKAEVWCDGKRIYPSVETDDNKAKDMKADVVDNQVDKKTENVDNCPDGMKSSTEAKAGAVSSKAGAETSKAGAEPVKDRVQPAPGTKTAGIYRLKALMNVRKAPSLNSDILGTKPKDAQVQVKDVERDWLHLADGTYVLYDGGKWAEPVVNT